MGAADTGGLIVHVRVKGRGANTMQCDAMRWLQADRKGTKKLQMAREVISSRQGAVEAQLVKRNGESAVVGRVGRIR